MLFYITAAIVTAIDQWAKIWIRNSMEVGQSVPFWDPVLHFTYYENSGMAHSLFPGYGRLFALFAVLFIAGVLYYRAKGEIKGRWMDLSMGFLVGGAAGNAIDRILFGKVTDFLEFTSGHGILNLADVAINIGVLLVIVSAVIGIVKKTGSS
ncbi:signal peptidase II [Paenibacillus doosanensis]|uniref:Lipoprotein signal peptidase n=1 Tax=Paenibacillus konkukensis TaxID=2020716 RepID=A0ABY4RU10_9BACL|nr:MULTISPECIES: signal peptidase II [Paenibacillus]MCS7460783.1 signal peptidase II [Paenibacillus doosanensis]UQZ85962.1 Lipoprotein signal peptidase [Paenibacillus konkukensis]